MSLTESIFANMNVARPRVLAEVARRLRFSFHEHNVDRQLVFEWFNQFVLFQEERGGTVRSIMCGDYLNARVRVFDFLPMVRGCWQTVVAFELSESRLPAFALWPRGARHEPRKWFGIDNVQVDLSDRPAIAAHYELRGSNASCLRRLLPPQAIEHFGNTPGWSIEGRRQWLIVHRQGRRCKPKQLRAFLREAWESYRVFMVK